MVSSEKSTLHFELVSMEMSAQEKNKKQNQNTNRMNVTPSSCDAWSMFHIACNTQSRVSDRTIRTTFMLASFLPFLDASSYKTGSISASTHF